MIKKLSKENMGRSNLGWLESRFHFSFAEYRNPDNINFGVLRVLNDDIIHPNGGFDTHPHRDMEIITYVINGELTHKDSMGNEETLKRGEVQYLSAGEGIYHSEYNKHLSKDLRLLQIWIIPPQKGLPRLYGSHKYKKTQRENKLLNIVSSLDKDSEIKIHQDVDFFVSEVTKETEFTVKIKENRQLYFVQIEGSSFLNNINLNYGDAAEITEETTLLIKALEDSHFLFIDLPSINTF
jgi:redox-sensitive bicupin YhaK (pirin superfamily)